MKYSGLASFIGKYLDFKNQVPVIGQWRTGDQVDMETGNMSGDIWWAGGVWQVSLVGGQTRTEGMAGTEEGTRDKS